MLSLKPFPYIAGQVEGLMVGLDLSPDNKFAAAWTNNDQTILLNTLIGAAKALLRS